MYQFQGASPGGAPQYQRPPPSQYPGYPPQSQAPPGQYPGYAAHHNAQQIPYGQYASHQQPQAPGVYLSGQPYQAPVAYASNQQPHQQQQQQVYGSNQAHPPGAFPTAATTQSSIQSCYNCGRSDHWAQDCPEPRRAVPAGALNDARPFKRQKTAGPIITRYPPPPSHNSLPLLQRGFTHPPVGHQAFPTPQGPPAPLSANGHTYPSWKSHQNSYVSPATQQASQQWTPPVPTPTSSYGPQYASLVSTNGTAHQNYFNSHPPSTPSQASPPRNNSCGSVGPAALPTPSSLDSSSYPKPFVNSSKQRSVSSDQFQTLDVNSGRVEPWLEELEGLDFEEMKSRSGPIISHPANPVAQPLPADCATADAIGRLPIAASLPPGVPISMYFRDMDEQEFDRNIREKPEWNEVCQDPAFAEIASVCDAISVSELVRTRHNEALVSDGSDHETAESDYEIDLHDQYSEKERLVRERSYSEDSVTADEVRSVVRTSRSRTSNPGEPKHITRSIETDQAHATPRETEDQRLSREQEERLAALGVSGLPKPVQPSMRRTVALTEPPKTVLASPVKTLDRHSRSTSLDKRALHGEREASPVSASMDDHSTDHSRDHSRDPSHAENSPYETGSATLASSRPSFSREDSFQDHNGREPLIRYNSYDRHHPPPPPPPPARKQRYFDRTLNRHSSPTDPHYQEFINNGHDRSPAGENANPLNDVLSPSRSRSNAQISRKRSYRHSSEESDGRPKRQEEETAQQRKRKHPKVADAYSRRW